MDPPFTKAAVLRTYDEIAEGVEERRQTPWTDVVDFEKSLQGRQEVLELGCGSGRNAVHFALAGHGVVALDFSRGMLNRARARVREGNVSSSVSLIQADVAAPPIKDSSVDVCLYVAALHHLPARQDRMRSLKELARCLRQGGRALISVWAFEQRRFEKMLPERKSGEEGSADIIVPLRAEDGRVVKRFYHLFVEGELEAMVREAGMDIERHFKSHDNYFVVAVRSHRH